MSALVAARLAPSAPWFGVTSAARDTGIRLDRAAHGRESSTDAVPYDSDRPQSMVATEPRFLTR